MLEALGVSGYAMLIAAILETVTILVIVVRIMIRRARNKRHGLTVLVDSDQAQREIAFQQKLAASHRRAEINMDRLSQQAHDKHLEDDGLLDPDQPTISSTLRKSVRG